jgi:methenyltetrahydrofolate cyclohydrolase
VTGLAEQPLGRFLEEVAEATPAPGGGSSAAIACALAAALVEMAARLAGGSEDDAERAGGLRRQALELAGRELTSYGPVLAALRLPRDDPSREQRLDSTLTEASEAPLAIAEAAAETAVLAAQVARATSPSVRGDALTGAVLAEAAGAAAATLVEINLSQRAGDAAVDRARAARRRAGEARARALELAPGGDASSPV